MSNLAKTGGDLKSLINSEKIQKEFSRVLPKHLTVERFTRIAASALSRNPKLLECTPASLLKCLMDLSAMGLEPDGRKAHLIPFENRKAKTVECTLIVDYKGIVELVRRDPNVLDVQAYTIRANDSAVFTNGVPAHVFDALQDRGEVKAVYTKIAWASGQTTYGEPLPWSEAEAVRNRSKAWQSFLQYHKEGPWNTDPVEMWKKTAIKRDSKMWPLSAEIRDALEKDGDLREERQVAARVVTPNLFAQTTPAIAEQSAEIAADIQGEPEAEYAWSGEQEGGAE